MKKVIFVCVIINFILISIFSFILFFNKNEVFKMIDVTSLTKEETIDKLEDFNIEFIEIDSNLEKNTVVYTDPMKDEFIQKNQILKIYISNGKKENNYDNLVNKYYDDVVDYLNYLEKEQKVKVIIKKQLSDNYPDGVILSQSSNGKILENDTFTILINYNNPLILVPNLIGKTEEEVIEIFIEIDLNILFIYEQIDGSNKVYNQSISPNSLVLNGTILYVYIST